MVFDKVVVMPVFVLLMVTKGVPFGQTIINQKLKYGGQL
jgi:hypothetical protein